MLGKSLKPNQKGTRRIKGRGLGLSHKRGHTIYIWLFQESHQTSWAIFILRWEDQLAVLCAKANKMFMRTVQQNVFLILDRVSVTVVIDPELIRPSIPVMTHPLDQKVVARKAKARKYTAEIVNYIQAKVDRYHRLRTPNDLGKMKERAPCSGHVHQGTGHISKNCL